MTPRRIWLVNPLLVNYNNYKRKLNVQTQIETTLPADNHIHRKAMNLASQVLVLQLYIYLTAASRGKCYLCAWTME